ncbi:MAG: hypothetical protein ACOC2W_04185 [bacterium]
MKRLIKQSEFLSGFDDSKGIYNEIFINPNKSEINDIKNSDNGIYGIRGFLYTNGDVVVWPGEIEHSMINHYVPQIDRSNVQLLEEDNVFWVTLSMMDKNTAFHEMMTIVKNCEHNLSKFLNIDNLLIEYFKSDNNLYKYKIINKKWLQSGEWKWPNN